MVHAVDATVGALAARLEESFPAQWAEAWDNVGLVQGDPGASVRGVLVTLDATRAALARAVEAGCNVLVTHHPPYLKTPSRLAAGHVAYDAAATGVAMLAAHTNLDRAPGGAGVLAAALGLPAGEPVERSVQEVDIVTAFVPPSARARVVEAMHASGAGRIGMYEGCSFAADGTGRFSPSAGTTPAVGAPGVSTETAEQRIEVVCATGLGPAVAAAAVAVHPYEEPLVMVGRASIARGAARLGRICDAEEGMTLADAVQLVTGSLGCVPRVWGDASSPVRRIATATGSAGSLLPDVVRAGADVLIAGEVRYHDALSALESGVAVIEAGHDVTEWPLVRVLADAVAGTQGLDPGSIHVEGPSRGWWTP